MSTGSKKQKSALIINEFEIRLNLGVTAKERSKKQKVLVSIRINFHNPPLACKTEKISDAVCYDTMIKKIREYCRGKKFILIENLCSQLFFYVKKRIGKSDGLYLSVSKLSPVKGLKHAAFEISDF